MQLIESDLVYAKGINMIIWFSLNVFPEFVDIQWQKYLSLQ